MWHSGYTVWVIINIHSNNEYAFKNHVKMDI